jgi:hypothetical protein
VRGHWLGLLVAHKWTYAKGRCGHAGVFAGIRRLVVWMAEENPTWGYTRIRGALKNVGHLARLTCGTLRPADFEVMRNLQLDRVLWSARV